MQSDAFDDLARRTGTMVSRREILRYLLSITLYGVARRVGLAGAGLLPADTPRPCEAVNSGGQCPGNEKIPHPNPPPHTDLGNCGNERADFPDSFLKVADFRPACANHDLCYSHCSTPKLTCDALISVDMARACLNSILVLPQLELALKICLAMSAAYGLGLATADKATQSWITAQQKYCLCCGSCPPDHTECEQSCCGPCEACNDGSCVPKCTGDQLCCNEACVSQDANNCGGCGVECGSCSQCIDGGCSSGCEEGQRCCDGACVEDCGSCDGCGPGQICCGGSCRPECGPCEECDPISGGCVSKCNPFGEQCCNGTCWAGACCDDGEGGKMCCPDNCSCCGPAVGGGCQTTCDGQGQPCEMSCGA